MPGAPKYSDTISSTETVYWAQQSVQLKLEIGPSGSCARIPQLVATWRQHVGRAAVRSKDALLARELAQAHVRREHTNVRRRELKRTASSEFRKVVALLQAEVPPGVLVNRDYDPSLPDLTGDSELLIQALLNVARNAAQAVGTNGWIEFRTRIDRNCTRRQLTRWRSTCAGRSC